jgi:uncharacterized protein
MHFFELFISGARNKGRGIFTSEAIPENATIEIAPVIVLEKKDRASLDQTLLHDYIFEWNTSKGQSCVALGYVSIYNHSYQANCEYEMDMEDETITIKSVRPINAGDELSINYNGNWNDSKPLWFEAT